MLASLLIVIYTFFTITIINVQAEQVDLSRSKYFEKNPKVMATARGKSLALFDKIAEGKMLTHTMQIKNFATS